MVGAAQDALVVRVSEAFAHLYLPDCVWRFMDRNVNIFEGSVSSLENAVKTLTIWKRFHAFNR